MLSDDITLNPHDVYGAGTDAGVVFALKNIDGGNSERTVTGLIGTPHTLTISHQTSGGEGKEVDRHLVRIDRVFAETETAGKQTLSAYLVLVVPQRTVVQQDVYDAIGMLADLFTSSEGVTNLTKILGGES